MINSNVDGTKINFPIYSLSVVGTFQNLGITYESVKAITNMEIANRVICPELCHHL
ncbi:MAG: hypothetical protein QXJ17_07360 [Nitrososphaeria archaeon]